MRRLVLVLALVATPDAVRARDAAVTPAATPAREAADSSARGARDGREAAHGRGRAPASYAAGLVLGFWAGRAAPPWMTLTQSGISYAGLGAVGVLAGAAATGSQGERSILERDGARIAPMSDRYRWTYGDAYRREFAAARRRDILLSSLLFVATALTVVAVGD